MAKTEDLLSILNNLSAQPEMEDEFIPSGSVIFDSVVSNGKGIPRCKFIELSADTGLGKSTIALHMCKSLCSKDFICVYLDTEKSVNADQLEGIGLAKYQGKTFFHFPITTFEEAEAILDKILTDDDRLGLICVDSITGLIPQKLMESSVADIQPGLKARYASDFLSKYRGLQYSSGSKATFLFLNQMRTKLDFKRGSTYEAAGGSAQKFYVDVRLMMRNDKKLTKVTNTAEGRVDVPYGCDVRLWATKNRFARPYVEGIITVLFGKGVSNIAAYQRWILNKGYAKVGGGGWYTVTFPELPEAKVRGMVEFSKWVKENLSAIKPIVEQQGGFLLIQEQEE